MTTLILQEIIKTILCVLFTSQKNCRKPCKHHIKPFKNTVIAFRLLLFTITPNQLPVESVSK